MDADELLRKCLHYYMLKRGWNMTAEAFRTECRVPEYNDIDLSGLDGMWSHIQWICDIFLKNQKAPAPEVTDNEGDQIMVQQLVQGSSSSGSALEGISLQEVASIAMPEGSTSLCHFSSDGKFLVCANSATPDEFDREAVSQYHNKIFIWSEQTRKQLDVPAEHLEPITDIRFKPYTSIFATSCLESIKIWDAARIFVSSKPLETLPGESGDVYYSSLDFHPTKDILCLPDNLRGKIYLWDLNQSVVMKAFEPLYGKLLASMDANKINIYDIDTSSIISTLRHESNVLSMCWAISGEHIASVCLTGAHVWSLSSGCSMNALPHESCCIYHPVHPHIMIVGGSQSLGLWVPETGERLSIQGHNGKVDELETSLHSGWIASVSNAENCVKVWK